MDVKMAPNAVGLTEETELQTMMKRLELENREVKGNEPEEDYGPIYGAWINFFSVHKSSSATQAGLTLASSRRRWRVRFLLGAILFSPNMAAMSSSGGTGLGDTPLSAKLISSHWHAIGRSDDLCIDGSGRFNNLLIHGLIDWLIHRSDIPMSSASALRHRACRTAAIYAHGLAD